MSRKWIKGKDGLAHVRVGRGPGGHSLQGVCGARSGERSQAGYPYLAKRICPDCRAILVEAARETIGEIKEARRQQRDNPSPHIREGVDGGAGTERSRYLRPAR